MNQLLEGVSTKPERDELGRWLPGTYAPQRKTVEGMLRKAAHAEDAKKLRRACDRLISLAADAEDDRVAIAAFSLIAARLDGKAVARIETTDGDTRSLDLAALVSLVMQHRKSEAIDAHTTPSIEGGEGMGDIPVEQEQAGGG